MEKKIIAIMVALVVVAMVVVAAVTIGVGAGGRHAGGFTALFDKLSKDDINATSNPLLKLPDSWRAGDTIEVSDMIVDKWYRVQSVGQTHVYTTHLVFAYLGEKWNNPEEGSTFRVPQHVADAGSSLQISHGTFTITVSTATNLTAKYDIGDTIRLTTQLSQNSLVMLAFGEWLVAETL